MKRAFTGRPSVVGWCVRFPRSCLPLSPLVSRCLPLSPFLFPFVGWRARLPEVLSPLVSPFVGWCVRLPEVLSPVSLFVSRPVSPCLPLSPLVLHCLPLSPLVSHCFPLSPPPVCLCWMMCPPSQGLVSHCLPLFLLASQLGHSVGIVVQ